MNPVLTVLSSQVAQILLLPAAHNRLTYHLKILTLPSLMQSHEQHHQNKSAQELHSRGLRQHTFVVSRLLIYSSEGF